MHTAANNFSGTFLGQNCRTFIKNARTSTTHDIRICRKMAAHFLSASELFFLDPALLTQEITRSFDSKIYRTLRGW